MFIKILNVLLIFLVVRFLTKMFRKYTALDSSSKKTQSKSKKDEDIIDAEYTVINEKKH